jgi:hypothetical protein
VRVYNLGFLGIGKEGGNSAAGTQMSSYMSKRRRINEEVRLSQEQIRTGTNTVTDSSMPSNVQEIPCSSNNFSSAEMSVDSI